MIALILAAFVGYAIGCISFANIVARRSGIADLRSVGDRNPGYWNARRLLGVRGAVPILLLDAAKGAVAVAIGLIAAGVWGGVVAWGAVVLGHMFPATMGFRGGRSLLCLAGGAIVLVPLACVVAAVALFVVRWRWDFARGIQAGLIVAPFAVWIIYGPNLELYVMVILLLGVALRAYLADRALRRVGIDKHQLD